MQNGLYSMEKTAYARVTSELSAIDGECVERSRLRANGREGRGQKLKLVLDLKLDDRKCR